MIALCPRAWAVTVLLLTIVHPAISRPIQLSPWAESHDISDSNIQDTRIPYDEGRSLSSLESAQAKFKLVSFASFLVHR
jgi:hypothetical protein